jgi:hypothetical protein
MKLNPAQPSRPAAILELGDLVARQHGAVSHSQLVALGIPSRTFRGWLRYSWRTAHPGVMINRCVPESFLQRCWAAWLAAGEPSVISHDAAARIHGLRTFDAAGVVVNAPRGDHHRIEGVKVRQISDVFRFPAHMATVGGWPVTTVARTLVDLGAVVRQSRLRLAMDSALDDRKTTVDEIGLVLRDVARRGKRGLRSVARELGRREPGPAVPRSHLERRLVDVLKLAGIPLPAFQAPLPGSGPTNGLVDCLYSDCLLIIEVDGRRWHARIAGIAKDHERDTQAAAAGYLTLRLLYEHLHSDPEGTAKLIAETRRVRLAQLAA